MRQRLWIGLALTMSGCLGLDWGGQSGAENTNFRPCQEVAREAVDRLDVPSAGVEFSIQDVLRLQEGSWTGELTADSGDYTLTARLALDGDPSVIDRATSTSDCSRAYVVPLRLTIDGGETLGAAFSFEAVADKVNVLHLSGPTPAQGLDTNLERPWPDAEVWLTGEFLSEIAWGDLQWTDVERSQPLGEWHLDHE